MQRSRTQMSEALINAVFLTLSGGFQDAYTYCCRQSVFANAQTGNIVLMSLNMFKGEWFNVLRYLTPVLAFLFGVFIAETVHRRLKYMKRLHWRQLILIAETVLLFAVGFMPHSLDILANALVSFVCAMQVQAFRKIDGYFYASTMCIGNMRSATESLCAYCHDKDKDSLRKSLEYFAIIFIFAVGAGLGSVLTGLLGIRAIWVSCALLMVSFCAMFM